MVASFGTLILVKRMPMYAL
ncbi:hypothetical protein [Alteromonas sp. 1_MG-2023]